MIMLIEELCMQIVIWVLQLTDAVMELFNSLTGVSGLQTAAGEDAGTLMQVTFGSSAVSSIFWSVVVVAVMLLALFSIIAIIRNMIKNDKRISEIVGKILIAVVGMFAVMAIIILAMAMVDELVVLLAQVFKLDPSLTFSQILLDACVPSDAWHVGYDISEVDISTLKVDKFFGDYKSGVMGIWPKEWKMNGMIDPDQFYYVPALVGSIVTLVYIFIATVNLGKRIFELVYLYFCMPPAMAVLPLDDGARIKNWTEAFTARMVIVFGSMMSVSIFYLLMPIISSLKIPGLGNLGNTVFMIILILSAAAFIPQGGRLFERIFVSREEAFFDGHNSGLMTVYRGMEKYERMVSSGARMLMNGTRRFTGWVGGIGDKSAADKSAKQKAAEEGVYREEQLGYLKSIAENGSPSVYVDVGDLIPAASQPAASQPAETGSTPQGTFSEGKTTSGGEGDGKSR